MNHSIRSRRIIQPGLIWVLVAAFGCWGQECLQPPTQAEQEIRYRVIRAIEDPGTHQSWLLVRDLSRPGYPGQLVCRSHVFPGTNQRLTEFRRQDSVREPSFSHLVIRSGDFLIVDEHSEIADVRLEGTALSAAAVGESLTVRLKIGGRVLRATAAGPGSAHILSAANEAHP